MSDFGPAAPDRDRVAEITSLRLTYGLLTRYTSVVAVQEIVRTAESAEHVDQPLPLPAGVSNLAVGVTRGPEPEFVWVCAIALALFAGMSAFRTRGQRGAVS